MNTYTPKWKHFSSNKNNNRISVKNNNNHIRPMASIVLDCNRIATSKIKSQTEMLITKQGSFWRARGGQLRKERVGGAHGLENVLQKQKQNKKSIKLFFYNKTNTRKYWKCFSKYILKQNKWTLGSIMHNHFSSEA